MDLITKEKTFKCILLFFFSESDSESNRQKQVSKLLWTRWHCICHENCTVNMLLNKMEVQRKCGWESVCLWQRRERWRERQMDRAWDGGRRDIETERNRINNCSLEAFSLQTFLPPLLTATLCSYAFLPPKSHTPSLILPRAANEGQPLWKASATSSLSLYADNWNNTDRI